MASRRKTSGLTFYSLLRKEAYNANKNLKNPLTTKTVERLVKHKLFKEYRGHPYSRISKTTIRSSIDKVFKSEVKKNNKAQLYGKLLHEVSSLNKSLPENQQLSLSQRREFTSQFIYPKFKGISLRKLKWIDVKRFIAAKLREQKKDVCDVTAIPIDIFQGINYFEIDDLLGRVLPPCVFVEVNAVQYGVTDIFNTRDYNYYGSGLQHLTSAINNAVAARELTGYPKYSGSVQVRPGRKNDGNPVNYYIAMVLEAEGMEQQEVEIVKIPKLKKTDKRKKLSQSTKNYINERLKKLDKEENRIKPIRRKLAKMIHEARISRKTIQKLIKDKYIPASTLKKWEQDFYKRELSKLQAFNKKGIFKRYQYSELIKQIKNAFK